jgi:23S rRNA pseudouridine1911/1915/1917 synthase
VSKIVAGYSGAMEILFEDNHLLVVNKQAGLATMGDPGEPTVHQWGCEYLREKYRKPGRVFLGIVSRLDKPTTGALVLARTSKAAARLSEQFAAKSESTSHRTGKYEPAQKVYLAIVAGHLKVDETWQDHCVMDDPSEKMRVVDSSVPGAKVARCRVRMLAATTRYSLLAIHLHTGRKHQIRLQCASRGHPIVGEFKYASGPTSDDGMFLHSWILGLTHPIRTEPMSFVASPPSKWRKMFADPLGDAFRMQKLLDQVRSAFGLSDSHQPTEESS